MIQTENRNYMKETDSISMGVEISTPKKDPTEHSFRNAPGYFTWDVIPGASGPYAKLIYINLEHWRI